MIKSAWIFIALAFSSVSLATPPAATQIQISAKRVVGAGDCLFSVQVSPRDGTTFVNVSSLTGHFHSYFGPLKKAQIPLNDGVIYENHQESSGYGKTSVVSYTNGIFEMREREFLTRRGNERDHTLRIAVSPDLTDVRFAEIEIIQSDSGGTRNRHLSCEF